MLTVPPGQYTLKERLYIERPWLVLRGAGSAQTTLFFPKNLMELYGPSPEDSKGFYVNEGEAGGWVHVWCRWVPVCSPPTPPPVLCPTPVRLPPFPAPPGGFITMRGKSRQGTKLASVTGAAKKGDNKLTVGGQWGLHGEWNGSDDAALDNAAVSACTICLKPAAAVGYQGASWVQLLAAAAAPLCGCHLAGSARLVQQTARRPLNSVLPRALQLKAASASLLMAAHL